MRCNNSHHPIKPSLSHRIASTSICNRAGRRTALRSRARTWTGSSGSCRTGLARRRRRWRRSPATWARPGRRRKAPWSARRRRNRRGSRCTTRGPGCRPRRRRSRPLGFGGSIGSASKAGGMGSSRVSIVVLSLFLKPLSPPSLVLP